MNAFQVNESTLAPKTLLCNFLVFLFIRRDFSEHSRTLFCQSSTLADYLEQLTITARLYNRGAYRKACIAHIPGNVKVRHVGRLSDDCYITLPSDYPLLRPLVPLHSLLRSIPFNNHLIWLS